MPELEGAEAGQRFQKPDSFFSLLISEVVAGEGNEICEPFKKVKENFKSIQCLILLRMKQQAFFPHVLSDNDHKKSLKAMYFQGRADTKLVTGNAKSEVEPL